MAIEVNVTTQEVEVLAKKLDEFGSVLTDHEHLVMLGVFGLAAKSLREAAEQSKSEASKPSSKPALSAGFKNAFTPGAATTFRLGTNYDAEDAGHEKVEVGVSVKVKF